MIRAHLSEKNQDNIEDDVEEIMQQEYEQIQSQPNNKILASDDIISNQEQNILKNKENDEITLEMNEWTTKQPQKTQKAKKLHKGSLLPSGAHVNWKDEIEKILK